MGRGERTGDRGLSDLPGPGEESHLPVLAKMFFDKALVDPFHEKKRVLLAQGVKTNLLNNVNRSEPFYDQP